MIRLDLAIRLRDAGVAWEPAAGDHFAIPDRDLDDQTFVLSDMIVGIHELPRGTVIGFNGTTEWALDDIERDEAIWLPREDQLRAMLGDAFDRLERDGDAYRVVVNGQADVLAATPEDAYGAAVLQQLRTGQPQV
ncbi:hypothetical protein GCM10009557_93050 [Virgisporangium ochraceum]|uniref:pilus assembly protein CpaE n=1 Tax=Virgisporangium ochraceum TaxID=65505 RepID=UPI001940D1FC|nr:pilus assembly protein CpaE [Virgisporangium ochraceum]